jgi:hypothetical protein
MITKIFAGAFVVLLAVSLLASVPVATAATKADRAAKAEQDFYQCSQPGTVLPPIDDLKTCMVERGDSERRISSVINSLPDKELFAPYTGWTDHEAGGR